MTDTYLRSLGFAPTARTPRSNNTRFGQAWRYQYDHLAVDGTPLFIEHPLGIEACWLSALEAPLTSQDVFAAVGLHDRLALQEAMSSFYTAHGGMGAPLPSLPTSTFHPYRYQQ